MNKKTHFWPDLGPLGPNSGPNFFSKIWLCQSLDIMAIYHHVQHLKKLIIHSWENLVADEWTNGWTDGQTERPVDWPTDWQE